MTNNDDIITKLTINTGTTTTACTVSSSLVEIAEYLIKGAITFSTLESSTEAFNFLGPFKSTLALSSSTISLNTSSGTIYPYDYVMPADTILDDGNSSMFHLDDKKASSEIEKNAEKIYDTFNKSHEPSESLDGLVIPTPELAARLNKILSSEDKKTLYEALTALQEVLEEIEKQKSDQAKLEFKQK